MESGSAAVSMLGWDNFKELAIWGLALLGAWSGFDRVAHIAKSLFQRYVATRRAGALKLIRQNIRKRNRTLALRGDVSCLLAYGFSRVGISIFCISMAVFAGFLGESVYMIPPLSFVASACAFVAGGAFSGFGYYMQAVQYPEKQLSALAKETVKLIFKHRICYDELHDIFSDEGKNDLFDVVMNETVDMKEMLG